jgi:hypothetical protein
MGSHFNELSYYARKEAAVESISGDGKSSYFFSVPAQANDPLALVEVAKV